MPDITMTSQVRPIWSLHRYSDYQFSQLLKIHNFLIVWPILFKLSPINLSDFSFSSKNNFSFGLDSPLILGHIFMTSKRRKTKNLSLPVGIQAISIPNRNDVIIGCDLKPILNLLQPKVLQQNIIVILVLLALCRTSNKIIWLLGTFKFNAKYDLLKNRVASRRRMCAGLYSRIHCIIGLWSS